MSKLAPTYFGILHQETCLQIHLMMASFPPATPTPFCVHPLQLTPNTAIVVATPPEQHRRFRLEMKHPCLLSMWNEWYGFDLFSDCFGGIDGRNKQHGSTWRKHLNASAYSRSSQLIKGINAFALEHHLRPEEVIAEWDPLFVCSKLSTYNMVRAPRSTRPY